MFSSNLTLIKIIFTLIVINKSVIGNNADQDEYDDDYYYDSDYDDDEKHNQNDTLNRIVSVVEAISDKFNRSKIHEMEKPISGFHENKENISFENTSRSGFNHMNMSENEIIIKPFHVPNDVNNNKTDADEYGGNSSTITNGTIIEVTRNESSNSTDSLKMITSTPIYDKINEPKYNEEEEEYDDCANHADDSNSIDSLINKLMPDDLEEGQRLNVSENVDNMNQTIAIINRLTDYIEKTMNGFKSISQQLKMRFSELLLSTDLPHECLAALIRINNGINEGQLWALKCKY